jgi:hypothetical protein
MAVRGQELRVRRPDRWDEIQWYEGAFVEMSCLLEIADGLGMEEILHPICDLDLRWRLEMEITSSNLLLKKFFLAQH